MKRNLNKEFDYDKKLQQEKAGRNLLDKKYKEALKQIEVLEQRNVLVNQLKNTVQTYTIEPKVTDGQSEATCVWVASDWHVEENVDPKVVNNLNEYNMKIAKQRAEIFFRSGLRITDMLARDIQINTIVLALLGDFITNDIHDALVEINEVSPMHATLYAQELIASGINYILKNSKYDIVIPCVSGNHGRTTAKTRFATENGHSLEFFMYAFLQKHFARNKRVKFLLAEGMHLYVDIMGYTIRFLHGHSVRYQGGVGGLTIPLNKKIAQWDKAVKADLTVLGHFHQFLDGGISIVNGSMIGYNSYALEIAAGFEKPKQALFLIDKKRGKTMTCPIMFD